MGCDKEPRVDVVIPVCRPDERLMKILERLRKQSRPVGRIYIIHTKSGEFPDMIETLEGVSVKHIEPEEFDHGGTRDLGFQLSDAGIVVFMTQDAVPADRELIRELVRPLLEREDVGASYARQLPAKGCGPAERYTRQFNYPKESRIKGKEDIEELGIKAFFCSDVCAAYRREIYDEMGGFTKKTIFNEDMVMAAHMIQAGYKTAYAANAKVFHSHNYTGIQQFKRNFDLAVSQADHPEVFAGIRSESEGIRMVKQTVSYLLKRKKARLIPALIWQSGCKYAGYRMGLNYRRLPFWVIEKCTANRLYWMRK
ncbi:MAG: glycosyltransferase family 2 protein [Dorea sp.]|jgi:rhamnosyltransferase|nr:glycosyltransferase family 2 protein [Dorea sp.]